MAKNKKAASKINSKKKSTKASNSSFKNTVSNFVNYIKLHKVASLLIAVILFGLLVYGGLIVYEKWQFNKAEKALDNLYSDIVKELGEPIEVTKDKSCAYSSAKFSQGDRSCRVGYLLKGTENKADYANKLYLATKKSDAISKIDGNVYNFSPELNYSFHFKTRESSLDCSVSVDQSKNDGTHSSIACYGYAKREYYPVTK